MPPLLIRPANPADAQTLADYNAAMALETEHKRLDPPRVLAGVRHAIENAETARYFVAEIDGRVVGQLMITTEWSDWRNADFWWIMSVYVRPEHRGGGVFKALYRFVESLARNDPGVCGLRLYVERENERAQHVYRKLGMSDAGYAVYEVDWSESSPYEQDNSTSGPK